MTSGWKKVVATSFSKQYDSDGHIKAGKKPAIFLLTLAMKTRATTLYTSMTLK